jgi:predicted extracellular nuclease
MKLNISIIFASAVMMNLAAERADGAVLITQYYEGPSTNKWIEITNTGTTAVNLVDGEYKLSLWTNANAEGYKTNLNPSSTMSLTGTLSPGASFVYGNTGNTTPTYTVATATNNTVINFNGNDSVSLWVGATFATLNIVDVVAFTNSGNEGADKSFIRLNAGTGWNTTAGSSILGFSQVWEQVSLTNVNEAAAGTEERLGFSAIPEPTAALLGSLGLLGLLRRRRGH